MINAQSQTMLIFKGENALSEFRLNALFTCLSGISKEIEALEARFVYFVEREGDAGILAEILPGASLVTSATSLCDLVSSAYNTCLLVIPREYTISPWSSKASDIAQICGVETRIERGIVYGIRTSCALDQEVMANLKEQIFDRMTHRVLEALPGAQDVFSSGAPRPLLYLDLIGKNEQEALELMEKANKEWGLALAKEEMVYIIGVYRELKRNPTDAELMMFAQVNSEHCRHKIFRGKWELNHRETPFTLFEMIRNTYKQHPDGVISAYSDNAAVLKGQNTRRFAASKENAYAESQEPTAVVIKVETHNHPTAISPFPGAATGSGGEIRDEGAVGVGSKPLAGLVGFATSDLCIPGYVLPWERKDIGRPSHISSALEIMRYAPLGAAAFNNEFGRPGLTGYFRTLTTEISVDGKEHIRGYHKPVMIAGGFGTVRPQHALKQKIIPGACLLVLGGPSMLIGVGGGAASSMQSGASEVHLDFASVQRENPEMQRRCQQVIDACTSLDDNPILSIHDVGAGGLSNALPELVHDANLGAEIDLSRVLLADLSLSPMEIWCNESQERYVLAVPKDKVDVVLKFAQRERCPCVVVGEATEKRELIVWKHGRGSDPVVHLRMDALFGSLPLPTRVDESPLCRSQSFAPSLETYLPDEPDLKSRLRAAVVRVLQLPSVASKSFLITIGDRSVGGLVTRDQMVGRWQVPVSDVACASTGFFTKDGTAMAMGEKPLFALLNAAASARMAVGEAITNLVAADVDDTSSIKLSCNWMAAANHIGEGSCLYDAVEAVGMDLCPKLGICVPVGKDSLSMKMRWCNQDGAQREVVSPTTLNVTAYCLVNDVTKTLTPALKSDLDGVVPDSTELILVDLARGEQRLGGSALCQVFSTIGDECPDIVNHNDIISFVRAIHQCRDLILAYHDRSDGGLIITLFEMLFSGRAGVEANISMLGEDAIRALFNEELGVVLQIRSSDHDAILHAFDCVGFPTNHIHRIAKVTRHADQRLVVNMDDDIVFQMDRAEAQCLWSRTSFEMQKLRDNPSCAEEEFAAIKDDDDPGLFYEPSALLSSSMQLSAFSFRPKVAILREEGVNGHVEMAWAFHAAGFSAIDVHMTDLLNGHVDISDSSFSGVVACGGFSYGDVLGAAAGWAHTILRHEKVRDQFSRLFSRKDAFALGICNGCQLFALLRELVPGGNIWPTKFARNISEQFEARVCNVKVDLDTTCIFFDGLKGSILPVVVSHGEGRAEFESVDAENQCLANSRTSPIRYVDRQGDPTQQFPLNPNGSPGGLAGIVGGGGRILAMMPHPERSIRKAANAWFPLDETDGVEGPWMSMFYSARRWVG